MSGTETAAGASGVRIVGLDALPATATARELVGADHDGAGVCVMFVDAPPGHGPRCTAIPTRRSSSSRERSLGVR